MMTNINKEIELQNYYLLNAREDTNFVYRIEGVNLSKIEIDEINTINTKCEIQNRLDTIIQKGGKLHFETIDNKTFYNNLVLIESNLPQILSHLLLDSALTQCNTIKDLTDVITTQNPMHYESDVAHSFYFYKIKLFLTSIALGMTSTSVWNGKFSDNKEFYTSNTIPNPIYDKIMFEDYLLNNTRLESPSTTKYHYAKIEKLENGELIFKLNLQIRFI